MAGSMVLASLALTYWLHPDWIWLAVFVGMNLAQSGVTGLYPLAALLRKAGVREFGNVAKPGAKPGEACRAVSLRSHP
ncbi:MAG: DUF2892 domain-containing protein [Hydrogenophilales bacterium]|nr:DUF2892 domain-containing protein [Hydrogenophilales bacterium]